VELATLDCAHRQNKKSAFENLTIPQSHKLVLNQKPLWDEWREQGFTHVKLKGDQHFFEAVQEGFKVRVDWNARLTAQDFSKWLSSLSAAQLESLDFVEDPTVNPLEWNQFETRVRCAADWLPWTEGVDVQVLKPSRENPAKKISKATLSLTRLVVTHAMDHPIGRAIALYEAAQIFQKHPLVLDVCGLLSQGIYEQSPWEDQLKEVGPQSVALEGTGWGFDELLNRLEWKRL
jgi:L-alanine-DL-glutamate epimerase-like enolase superfamily enzyme